MDLTSKPITVVGGGLAGSECAYQLAEMGHKVHLYEMRDQVQTPAHKTNRLGELVCSNSFGSTTDYSAPGQLKWEAVIRCGFQFGNIKTIRLRCRSLSLACYRRMAIRKRWRNGF